MKYNIDKMVQDHKKMKDWHEAMAKSAAETMQDHIKAASWHESQSDMIKAMINEVPLDPEKKVTSIPSSGSSTPTPPMTSNIAGASVGAKEVPLDPSAVKKSDLISILSDHAQKFGDFDMDIESIANFLVNE